MQRTPYSIPDSRAAVYLIHRKDRQRFKVGWSSNPLTRAQSLPEFRLAQLDLRHSLALWLPSRQRAQQIERALHKSLAPFQVPAGHAGDGHSEWFAGPALPAAERLLRQMPGDGSSLQPPPLLEPLLPELVTWPPDATEVSAPSLWLDIEDLWLRLSTWLTVHAETWEGSTRLHFGPPRAPWNEEAADLRRRAADIDSYGWRIGGERGNFIRVVSDEGDRLVLTMASSLSISRWLQGEDISWQVQGFVARVRAMQFLNTVPTTALHRGFSTTQRGGYDHVPS